MLKKIYYFTKNNMFKIIIVFAILYFLFELNKFNNNFISLKENITALNANIIVLKDITMRQSLEQKEFNEWIKNHSLRIKISNNTWD